MPILTEKEKLQKAQEKYQAILSAMLRDDDNKYCVDCDAKGPRWASWNLGIFLCIRCAGIHRNLGVHISRVKSVNLDQWTAEQIASVQAMGNSKARAVYEANLPENYKRPQTDSPLEQFIRSKYEQRKWIAKEWMPPNISTLSTEFNEDEPVVKETKKKEASKTSHKIELEKKVPNNKTNPTKSESLSKQQFVKIEKEPEINLFDIDDVTPPVQPITVLPAVQQPTIQNENSFFNTIDNDFNELSFSYTPATIESQTTEQVVNNSSSSSLNEDIKSITSGKKAPIDKNSILALYNNNSNSLNNNSINQNNNNTLTMQNPALNMQQAQIQSSQYYPNNTMTFTAPTMNHPQMPFGYNNNNNNSNTNNNPQMFNRMQTQQMMNLTQVNQQSMMNANIQQQMSSLNLGQQQTNQATTWPNQAFMMQSNQWPNQASANNRPTATTNLNFNMTTTANQNSQNTMSSNLWQ